MVKKKLTQAAPFDESDDKVGEAVDEELELTDLIDDEPEAEAQPAVKMLAPEPLFSALLRRTVLKVWPDDPVLHDFVDYVAAPLSDHFADVTAKGGDFVKEKEAQGVDVDRFRADQSMRAHLINGLFPTLHVAKTLQRWGAPQFRYYDETVCRLFLASYVLHDWPKFPAVKRELEQHGLTHDTISPVKHLPLVEMIVRRYCTLLGLDRFLEPVGGVELLLHDLIYVISNTQLRWGTQRNLSELPRLHLHGLQRDLAEQLSRLSDYIAYAAGANPYEVVAHRGLHRELATLSNQMAQLTYHHIADVRGVITNLIQNAALDAMRSEDCVPLLYAPSGVVYLVRKSAQKVLDPETIAEAVVKRVKQVAGQRLTNQLTGFGRDGKGMKHADYYQLFFQPLEMFWVGLRATFKIVHPSKPASAGKRFAKLANWMEAGLTPEQANDIRIDQLAEWCYLAEKTARDLPGGGSAARLLVDAMGLSHLYESFLAVPRDVRAGGVGYHWYYIAGHYLQQNLGLDPQAWQERVAEFARMLTDYLVQQQPADTTERADGFADLRHYVQRVLRFDTPQARAVDNAANDSFAAELARYTNARKRGQSAICSLCSSPYAVTKQQEAAILFAPQVYSNKMTLHGSVAIRDICSICGLEIMLRQLLMNDTNAKGKDFEGRNLRYLYFYPAYFFTPETLELFKMIYGRLRNLSFTELRRQLEVHDGSSIRLDSATWQRLEALLLTAEESEANGNDRFLRMHFPENEPITFFFMGVPPGRDAKDAEAWVNPALLALLLPLCVDVKVVASSSSLPSINEASELNETVFLDGAHAAIGYIAQQERLNLDHVLPTLQRLAVNYLIHLDGNSGSGSKGFDYHWERLPPLARDLSQSSIYAFHYLKKWQRRVGTDAIPAGKAALYLEYQHYLCKEGDPNMDHARKLTELYRRFYRSSYPLNSNGILRPIGVAAKAIMAADRRLFDQEGLRTAVHGELAGFVDRVASRRADGYVPRIDSDVEGKKKIDEAAIAEFASYFVDTIFYTSLRGDISALRGKQLNLLKNACEVIYRDIDSKERAAKGEPVAGHGEVDAQ